MSLETVKIHLNKWNKAGDIVSLNQSGASVEQAAQALGVTAPEIAKSMSFYDKAGGVILLVVSGHKKVDSRKYKDEFGLKAKMLGFEDVEPLVGHPVGGVCPFGLNEGVKVFLDVSLKEFAFVYPACGHSNYAIKVSIPEIEQFSDFVKWVDVTKD